MLRSSLSFSIAFSSFLGLYACAGKKQTAPAPTIHQEPSTQTEPTAEDSIQAQSLTPSEGENNQQASAMPAGKPIHIRAHVYELDDLLKLVQEVSLRWNPNRPIDPQAEIQAMLLQLGYGPGLWKNLDTTGMMAVDATFPLSGSNVLEHTKMIGRVATHSAQEVIHAFPASQRPQPLGNGLWELILNQSRIYLREQPHALEFSLDANKFDEIDAFVSTVQGGRRLRLQAWDLPMQNFEVMDMIDNLPLSPSLQQQLRAILQDLKQVSFEVDAGTNRDVQMQLSAQAPFERLGIRGLGSKREKSTVLEQKLPANPALVVAIPWGSPEPLHATLRARIPVDEVPAPFDSVVRDILTQTHALLDQITEDVVLAAYISPRGEATFVLAAEIKAKEPAQNALREIEEIVVRTISSYNELAGANQADAHVKVRWKPDSVPTPIGKADFLALTVPKNLQQDAKKAALLLTKTMDFEVVTLVEQNTAILAMGAGARKLVANMHSRSKPNLATDSGLALARAASGGCQICISFDPVEMTRYRLTFQRDGSGEKEQRQELDKKLKQLAKVRLLDPEVGIGLQVHEMQGSIGVGVPKGLILPPPQSVEQVKEMLQTLF